MLSYVCRNGGGGGGDVIHANEQTSRTVIVNGVYHRPHSLELLDLKRTLYSEKDMDSFNAE